MKKYIIVKINESSEEVINGYFGTLKSAQKAVRDGETIYEISGMWEARPQMELDRKDLKQLAD